MIRLATSQDAKAMLTIYNDAILNTTAVYTYEVQRLEDRIAWLQQKEQDGFPVFVYEEDGEVIGFTTYGPFRPWPAYKYTVEHSIYVHPAHQGKGVGKTLLQHVIKDMNSKGYMTVVAGIDADNQGSIEMHQKQGFQHVGTIEKAGFKFDRWLHLAFYRLELEGPKQPLAK